MKKNYTEKAKIIIEGLGGKNNIESFMCCATRLRVDLKNPEFINKELIKKAGAYFIMELGGGAFQLIMGPTANIYEDEVKRILASE